MKTVLELFLITCVTEGFHVVRKSLDMTQECRDPDQVADEYIQFLFQDISVISEKDRYILHSTSWRYDAPRSIILTYLVYADSFTLKNMSPFLLRFEGLKLAHSENPKVPRPKELTQTAVISHGIRHLAYLIISDQKGEFRKVVSTETHRVFEQLQTQLAGRLN